MDPFLGEIRLFAGNFAPKGWAFCQGQVLSISQNSALFSLLGGTYGGNWTTTFALPDLRSRIPMCPDTRDHEDTGDTATFGADASKPLRSLGLNYIICIEGYYPSRP